ncbi:pyruvate formate-lyase-activating protein [Clostridium septicum]|uniref:Pyruvate formate-lyase-activating enzyme n=1 Tax=Clostridium septicum TaxID=1504 RepID=A0A9N7JJ09_CLOSE|nr:pyruvate formate-lyase-activating protein [Clostridium septicum]AYE33323.1 pyruvate formate-lyase 1-activating enzyme [Clostridium septicum]MDU1314439.1 pyruvate formate-lyase-activating protein [Clostridium septicum]QAS61493.1 pyruvate formate lyase-activating protein [Clostridium septicum]UEC22069.1 pyruvate formate lyase-activating protein [Clostridium septicum]USR99899.1 pyruvate formate-lyase-activating protein [Clostridium septicum]
MLKGRIHSIESMGLVDGPGIRVVVFMQGCALRCLYCHNPDTWKEEGGEEYTPQELVNKIERFKNYFKSSGGGVTFSGGDPLRQPEFLLEALKLCKETGIHTCLDTSGVGYGNYDEILKYTDLVLYDVKHLTEEGYKDMTGINMAETKKFLDACQRLGTKIWIRQVVVPGKTDSLEYMLKLKDFVNTLRNVEKVELLPYHLLGVNKYENLGLKYRLEGVPAMDKDKCKEFKELFI